MGFNSGFKGLNIKHAWEGTGITPTHSQPGGGAQHHVPTSLPPGKIRFPFYWRLGGPRGRSGRVRNLAAPGFGPRTVQLLAIPYSY